MSNQSSTLSWTTGQIDQILAAMEARKIAQYCKVIRRLNKGRNKASTDALDRAMYIAQLFDSIKKMPPSKLTYKIMDSVGVALQKKPFDVIRQVDSEPHQQALLRLYIKKCQTTPSELLYKLQKDEGNEDLILLTMTLL